MRLTDIGGEYLDLAVLGYQYETATDDLNANWLMIRGRVKHESKEWEFRDPCLMTDEIVGLASWLEGLVEPDTSGGDRDPFSDEIGFIEPCLSFRVESSL